MTTPITTCACGRRIGADSSAPPGTCSRCFRVPPKRGRALDTVLRPGMTVYVFTRRNNNARKRINGTVVRITDTGHVRVLCDDGATRTMALDNVKVAS